MSSVSLSKKERAYLDSVEFQQASVSDRLERSSFAQQESLRERKIVQLEGLQNSKKILVYKSISWMFYVAALTLAVVSLLLPAISSSLWYMPLVGGLVGSLILFIISYRAQSEATSREKQIEEVRIASDLLQEKRSLFLVGEADRDVIDERLISDRQAQAFSKGSKSSSQSTHSIGERCDRYDLAAPLKAKEIIANRFAGRTGRDSIYTEERWRGFTDRVNAGIEPDVDSFLGFTPIPDKWKARLQSSDLEKRKLYLPTFCKEYFTKEVVALGEEVQKLYGSLGFLADVQTHLDEFDALSKMMAATDVKKIDGIAIEEMTYEEAKKVLSRLRKCRGDLTYLKSTHHTNFVDNIREIIGKISKSYTTQILPKESVLVTKIEKELETTVKGIASLNGQQISAEEKIKQFEKLKDQLENWDGVIRKLEHKLIGRKYSKASTAKDILQARLIREEKGELIPTNPALLSRHITQIKLDDRLKRVDNKMWWVNVSKRVGPEVLMTIPLLIAAVFFASNPWWCFAAFCGELGVLPVGYLIGLYASKIEEEKRALKMYRDPEPRDPEPDPEGMGTPIVQMFDPEFKQIPATRPVLKELQDVTQRYGLEGMRPTASKLMVEDNSSYAAKLKTKKAAKKYLLQIDQKKAAVEKKTEDISKVYVQCLREQKAQLARLQKRSLHTFVTTRRDLSALAHSLATSEASLDEKMATLDEAMARANSDEERHEIQMLRGILSVEKQLSEISPEEEKAQLERKKKRAENELSLLGVDIELGEGSSLVQTNGQNPRKIELVREIVAIKDRLAAIGTTRMEALQKKGETDVQEAKEHLTAMKDENKTDANVQNYNAAWKKYTDLLKEEKELRAKQDSKYESARMAVEVLLHLQAPKKLWKNERFIVERLLQSEEVLLPLSQLVTGLKESWVDGQQGNKDARAKQVAKEKGSLTEPSFQFLQSARAQLAQCQTCESVEKFQEQLQELVPHDKYLQDQWEWMIKQLGEVEQDRQKFFSAVEAWKAKVHLSEDSVQLWTNFFSLYEQQYQRAFDGQNDIILAVAYMALRVHEKGVRVNEASVQLKTASDQLPKQRMID